MLFENDFWNFVEALGDFIGGGAQYCYDSWEEHRGMGIKMAR